LYKVVAIGEKDFCAGFALAGIETRAAAESALPEEIAQAIRSGTYGLIIIDEQVSECLEAIRPPGTGAQIPIVIPVPGRMEWHDVEQLGEDRYIAALIRRAVGYQLDLQL
jgi:vacuolar-type H+-ATPase subunit F/Vma7